MNKKATINAINKDDNKCFSNAATLALNHKEIGKELGRTTKFKPFIYKHNQKAIPFSSGKYNWKKFDKDNFTIAFNIKNEKIYPGYASNHNSKLEKQVTLFIIPNREGLYYVAGKTYQHY